MLTCYWGYLCYFGGLPYCAGLCLDVYLLFLAPTLLWFLRGIPKLWPWFVFFCLAWDCYLCYLISGWDSSAYITSAALVFWIMPVLDTCLFTLRPPTAISARLGTFYLSFEYFCIGGLPFATFMLTTWEFWVEVYSFLTCLVSLLLDPGGMGIWGLLLELLADYCAG